MMLQDKYAYRVIWSEEDGAHVGLCAEFPGLSWLASSQEKALWGIRRMVERAVRDMHNEGEAVPIALTTRKYSGSFKIRIPPEVHRSLVVHAAEQNISMNRFVETVISAGLGLLVPGRADAVVRKYPTAKHRGAVAEPALERAKRFRTASGARTHRA
jgi:predicted HicB family RNase H-like nuclease